MTTEIENYRKDGFTGFIPVSELLGNTKAMPDGSGVYIVVRESDKTPVFLAEGTGGFFKGKCISARLQVLENESVSFSDLVPVLQSDIGEDAICGSWQMPMNSK